jgi:hypothetical protein
MSGKTLSKTNRHLQSPRGKSMAIRSAATSTSIETGKDPKIYIHRDSSSGQFIAQSDPKRRKK